MKIKEIFVNWLLSGVRIKFLRALEIKIGEHTLSLVGNLVKWSASQDPSNAGEIGMDNATGRPRAYVGGAAKNVLVTGDAGGGSIGIGASGNGGRLQYSSNTALSFDVVSCRDILINAVVTEIGADTVTTAQNLLTSTGADAGAAMVANTLYYIYFSNAAASPWPTDLRASTTAPVAVTASDGSRYLALGAAGNALAWRCVGIAKTNGSTQFEDALDKGMVASVDNQKMKRLSTCPGYVDDNAGTAYTVNSPTWVEANAGTGSRLNFICAPQLFGLPSMKYFASLQAFVWGDAIDINLGAGLDSITQSQFIAQTTGMSSWENWLYLSKTKFHQDLVVGAHYLSLLFCGSGSYSAYADLGRKGDAADPPASVLEMEIWQ